MLRKPTLVNAAFADKISGGTLLTAAVLSFIYYGYCIFNLPLHNYPFADILVGEKTFLAFDYYEFGIKLLIKIFLIAAVIYAFKCHEHYANDRAPAYIWVCSLACELTLYIRNILVVTVNLASELKTGAEVNAMDYAMEFIPNIMSLLAFSLLIAVAVQSHDLLKAKTVRNMCAVTTVLAVLFLGKALIDLITLDHDLISLFGNLILFADGATVLIPSIMIMKGAQKEAKVHYTTTAIYVKHHKEP